MAELNTNTLKDQAQEVIGKSEQKREAKGGTVEVKKEDFQGLIATIQKLQKDLDLVKRESGMELPTIKFRKAKLHFYKGNPIVNVGSAWEIENNRGEPEMRLEIFSDKKYEVSYKAFVNDDANLGFSSEQAVIKEIKKIDDGVEIQGYTDLVEVDYTNYRSVAKGKVSVKVVTPKYAYIMELENGKLVELNPNALN